MELSTQECDASLLVLVLATKSKTSFAKWTRFSVTVKEWNERQTLPLVGPVPSGKRAHCSVKFSWPE